MSNLSFYGGNQGKDFKISKIFRSKVDLLKDLSMRWQSPVNVSDLVLISYGLPAHADMNTNDSEFLANKEKDETAYSLTYNSTLWMKIYTESDVRTAEDELLGIETIYVSGDEGEAKYGLGYRLIGSFTGETPNISVVEDVLDADKDPYVTFADDSTPEMPHIIFHLPQEQVLHFDSTFTDPMDENENLVETKWDYTDTIEEVDDPTIGSINDPLLFVTVPRPWKFKFNYDTIAADKDPTAELTNRKFNDNIEEMGTTKDTKYFEVRFPRPYKFTEKVTITNINTGEQPTATVDKQMENGKWLEEQYLYFDFHLPKQQIIRPVDVISTTIAPSENPSLDVDTSGTPGDSGSLEHPRFTFNLPRAVRFYYGEEEPQLISGDIYNFASLIDAEAAVGDYYINKITGDIWLIANIDKNPVSTTLKYQACLAGTMLQPQIEMIDSYADSTGTLNVPEVELNYEGKRPYFIFTFPQMPQIAYKYNELGSAAQGSIEQSFSQSTTTFTFNIPDGTKWFVGELINDNNITTAQVEGARAGDLYLRILSPDNYDDNYRGNVYKAKEQNGSVIWEKVGNLEGPVGKALNIIEQINIEGSAANQATLIESALADYTNIDRDEIIGVNFHDTDDNVDTSYWYYRVNGVWKYSTLTGGLGGLIKTSYVGDPNDSSHVYSTSYIDTLIQDVSSITGDLDKVRQTYSAQKIDEKIAAVNSNINSLSSDFNNFKSNQEEVNSNLNDEISNLKNDIQTINNSINDINTTLNNLQQQINSLVNTLTWGNISEI